MLLQVANIIGGALLSSTLIKSEQAGAFFAKLAPYEAWVGVALAILGVLGLIERLTFVFFFSGASFPQALPAIAAGLLLGWPLMQRYTFLSKMQQALVPYQVWVGVLAIACGLGSLLLGCVYPVCFAL